MKNENEEQKQGNLLIGSNIAHYFMMPVNNKIQKAILPKKASKIHLPF